MTSPDPVTASKPKVFSRVVPYLTARGPAALHARLPPMVQADALLGPGGQKKPRSPTACCSASLVTPGSATEIRLAASMRWMCLMRSKERTMPPRSGTLAPVVPVPRPRDVTGIFSRLQRASTSAS